MKCQEERRPALSRKKCVTANYPGTGESHKCQNLTCSDRHPCVTGRQGTSSQPSLLLQSCVTQAGRVWTTTTAFHSSRLLG